MDDYVAKTISAYNSDPEKYVNSTQDIIYFPEIEKFLQHIPKKGLILDAGCAFGRDTRVFASKGFKVTGIDLSEKLLEIARKLSPRIEYKQMDLRKLEFPDVTFDGIWCSASLLHLNPEDLKISLKGILRVLKNKGILYCSFKKGEGSKEVLESFSSNNSRFYTFLTGENLNKLLEETGFKVIETYEVNERERFGPTKRDLIWVHSFSKK